MPMVILEPGIHILRMHAKFCKVLVLQSIQYICDFETVAYGGNIDVSSYQF
jgi:hypothetical protein